MAATRCGHRERGRPDIDGPPPLVARGQAEPVLPDRVAGRTALVDDRPADAVDDRRLGPGLDAEVTGVVEVGRVLDLDVAVGHDADRGVRVRGEGARLVERDGALGRARVGAGRNRPGSCPRSRPGASSWSARRPGRSRCSRVPRPSRVGRPASSRQRGRQPERLHADRKRSWPIVPRSDLRRAWPRASPRR